MRSGFKKIHHGFFNLTFPNLNIDLELIEKRVIIFNHVVSELIRYFLSDSILLSHWSIFRQKWVK